MERRSRAEEILCLEPVARRLFRSLRLRRRLHYNDRARRGPVAPFLLSRRLTAALDPARRLLGIVVDSNSRFRTFKPLGFSQIQRLTCLRVRGAIGMCRLIALVEPFADSLRVLHLGDCLDTSLEDGLGAGSVLPELPALRSLHTPVDCPTLYLRQAPDQLDQLTIRSRDSLKTAQKGPWDEALQQRVALLRESLARFRGLRRLMMTEGLAEAVCSTMGGDELARLGGQLDRICIAAFLGRYGTEPPPGALAPFLTCLTSAQAGTVAGVWLLKRSFQSIRSLRLIFSPKECGWPDLEAALGRMPNLRHLCLESQDEMWLDGPVKCCLVETEIRCLELRGAADVFPVRVRGPPSLRCLRLHSSRVGLHDLGRQIRSPGPDGPRLSAPMLEVLEARCAPWMLGNLLEKSQRRPNLRRIRWSIEVRGISACGTTCELATSGPDCVPKFKGEMWRLGQKVRGALAVKGAERHRLFHAIEAIH